jgi:hypothetical protein
MGFASDHGIGEKTMRQMTLMMLVALAAAALLAPGARAQNAPSPDSIAAVCQSIEGDPDEVVLKVPGKGEVRIAKDAKYPEGTTIDCGDGVNVAFTLEGSVGGDAITNAVLAVRQTTSARIDKLVVQGDSVTTRLKLKTGEVRLKITQDGVKVATDMKVATPTATASIVGTELQAVGFNANRGSYQLVASGTINAANVNGTTRNVSGGGFGGEGTGTGTDLNLGASSSNNSPVGMTVWEVSAGQLAFSGVERPGSDANNPGTNPTGAGRGLNPGDLSKGYDSGAPLPVKPGRGR